MKSIALAVVVAAILWVPAGMIGRALHFGGLAWLMMFALVLLVAALVDREYFYGPRDPG